MSITPIDESRTGGKSAAVEEEPEWLTRRERLELRAREIVRSLPYGERILDFFDRRGLPDPPRSRIHVDGFADQVVDPPTCEQIEDFPPRDRPFSYPTRNHPERNTLDLVATEINGEIRISYPDKPGAHIRSDHWEPVEE